MVAPPVVVDRATVSAEAYVPAAGDAVGVATVAVPGPESSACGQPENTAQATSTRPAKPFLIAEIRIMA